MSADIARFGEAAAMTYPGGKNGAGIYQRIINHMPPHKTYIEAFLGSGAVLRNKRLAHRNVGIDRSEFRLLDGDALKLLPSLKSMVSDSFLIDQPDTLIYADPPT